MHVFEARRCNGHYVLIVVNLPMALGVGNRDTGIAVGLCTEKEPRLAVPSCHGMA